MMTKTDPCEYFTAARVILRDLFGVAMNYFYDDLTYENELFTSTLEVLNQ